MHVLFLRKSIDAKNDRNAPPSIQSRIFQVADIGEYSLV